MKTKTLELNVELMIPTNVTRSVKFPFYVKTKEDEWLAINVNDESSWAPFAITEVKTWNDSTARIYSRNADHSELATIVNNMNNGKFEEINREEFLSKYDKGIQWYINRKEEI